MLQSNVRKVEIYSHEFQPIPDFKLFDGNNSRLDGFFVPSDAKLVATEMIGADEQFFGIKGECYLKDQALNCSFRLMVQKKN